MFKWISNLFSKQPTANYGIHPINGYPCYRARVERMTSGSLLPTGQRVRDIILYRASQYGKIYMSDGSSMTISFENPVWVVDEGVLAQQLKAERRAYKNIEREGE